MAAGVSPLSSTKALAQELKKLKEQPVEGFRVSLANDEDFYTWDIVIFGPPDTLYQGGYFKARMSFPKDYPYSPPQFRFLSKFWHPNIYDTGDVCISILHPPGHDPHSGELPSERWNPTQNVRTILLSVISLLNEPNISSPANVDASVMYRKYRDGKGSEYKDIVLKQVAATADDAKRDNVEVPSTLAEYCQLGQALRPQTSISSDMDMLDYFDDYDDDGSDMDDLDDDDEEEEEADDDGQVGADQSGDNDSGTGTLNG